MTCIGKKPRAECTFIRKSSATSRGFGTKGTDQGTGRNKEEIQTKNKKKACAMKRAIHRQYGDSRHCHGVALFVDAAMFNDYQR